MARILDLSAEQIATDNQASAAQVVSSANPDMAHDAPQELGFIAGSYETFMQNNLFGSAARYGFLEDGDNPLRYNIDPDSTFNQYKHFLDNREEFEDIAVYVKSGALENVVSNEMFDDRVARLRAEIKHREQAGQAGLGGMLVGGILGGILDPTILLPVVGQAKLVGVLGKTGYMLERSLNNKVVRGLATGGYMSAVQEAELHVFQELRTVEESAFATGFGAVIGGGVGLFASAANPTSFLHPKNANYVFRPESRISMGVKSFGETMSESRVMQMGKSTYEEIADTSVGRSVGAAAVDTMEVLKAGANKGTGILQKGVMAVGRGGLAITNVINAITPLGAGLQSPSAAMRMITAKLYDTGGILNEANAKGVVTASVEDRASQMQRLFDTGILIGARQSYMDLQQKLAELAGKKTSVTAVAAKDAALNVKALYTDIMAGPNNSGKPRDTEFEGRTGNFQRFEFEDITTLVAHDDLTEEIMDNLKGRFGDEGAAAIKASAVDMADRIHAFNKIMEDELVRVGYLTDKQRLGKSYVAPQNWLGKAIRKDKAGARAFFLDIFAGKPTDDWLAGEGLTEDILNKLGREEVTVGTGDSAKTYSLEEGKQYKLSVLENWTGDKFYTELGALERQVDDLTLAEKDARQSAVLAARELRTNQTDIKNATVDEAVAVLKRRVADRDAARLESEKLKVESQRAKEELRLAEAEFTARRDQVFNTEGPIKKLNTERQGEVKEAKALLDMANADPSMARSEVMFARDNLTAADNELFQVPNDVMDKMVLDAAGRPISTPRLTLYRDRVRKLNAQINKLDKKINRLNPLLAKLAQKADQAANIKRTLLEAKKARRKLVAELQSEAGGAKRGLKKGQKALDKKNKASPLVVHVNGLVDNLGARNGSSVPVGMGLDNDLFESARTKLRSIKLSNEQRRQAQSLGFLDSNTFGSLHNGVQELSRRIAFKDTFGHYGADENAMVKGMMSDVETEFNTMIDKAKASGASTLKIRGLEAKRDRHVEYVQKGALRQLGLLELPRDSEDMLLWSLGKAREANFIRYGSGFLVASITDLSNVILTSGFGTFSRQNLRALDTTISGMGNSEIRRLASALELLMHNSRNMKISSTDDLANMMGVGAYGSNKHYLTSSIDRISSGIAQSTSMVSGMLWWNTRLKMLAMLEVQHNFVGMAGKYDDLLAAASAGDKAAENQIAQLASLGLGADQMRGVQAMLKKYPPEFTAHSPSDKEGVMELAMERWLKEGDAGQRAYQDVLTALEHAANRAVMTPGKGDTPFFMSTGYGKTLLQFQTYGFAIMNRYMMPAFQRMASYGDMEAFLSLGVGTAMGGAVVSIKDIINNGEIKDRDAKTWAYDVVDRSGLTAWLSPMFAQGLKLVGGETSRYSSERDRWALLAGPTGGLAQDVMDLGSAAIAGDGDRVLQTTKKLAPFNMLGKLWNMIHSSATGDKSAYQ